MIISEPIGFCIIFSYEEMCLCISRSAFPHTIITRVLMCGLKDYCQHGCQTEGDGDAKIPKMGSVVGILGHLASKHSHDIRDALMKLFQVSGPQKLHQTQTHTLGFH